MVLKFCGGIWPMSRPEDDVDATAMRQQRLRELLHDEPTATQSKKLFIKEVRVVFDDPTRPHGLCFGAADTKSDSAAAAEYSCEITSIHQDDDDASGSGGQASTQIAEYNARCKAMGDYANVLVRGMRVRAIDFVDQRGVGFDQVATKLTSKLSSSSSSGCSVTFADVLSAKIALSPSSPRKPKLKTVGNLVLAAQKQTNSSNAAAGRVPAVSTSGRGLSYHSVTALASLAPTSPTQNARGSVFNAQASPKVSKWSSVLTAVSVATTSESQSDVLAQDLSRKSAHLEAQILVLKGRLGALEREKTALVESHAQTTKDSDAMRQRLEQEREQLLATQQNTTGTSEEMARRCETLQHENDTLRDETAATTLAMEKLQHDYDAAMLQMHELQTEHRDVQQQTEEIHARLVTTQIHKSELLDQLTTLQVAQRKEDDVCRALLEAESLSPAKRRASSGLFTSTMLSAASHNDSAPMALLKRMLHTKESLQARNDELQIELSCHETTIAAQNERLVEMEDQLQAVQQIADSLRDQVRSQLLKRAHEKQEEKAPMDGGDETKSRSPSPVAEQLLTQLDAERQSKTRIQTALQALSDKARAKLELHEKEQLFLTQFKEQLIRGLPVTKYGATGVPHSRVLYSDLQCRWISWRSPSDSAAGSSSPRADAKLETIDLVEVLLGAKTETFRLQSRRPDVPARCLSLVFCHPCRTLDIELDNKERALFVRRGFRLLLEQAAEKRRQEEEDGSA